MKPANKFPVSPILFGRCARIDRPARRGIVIYTASIDDETRDVRASTKHGERNVLSQQGYYHGRCTIRHISVVRQLARGVVG